MLADEARGERRHLTVMFCDLVASSKLSEKLDPEDFRSVLTAYHETCAGVIDGLQGYVAQLLGDGVLAYFSYPEAHDDDAERAVRAGLRIVATLGELNPAIERDYGVRLAVRIGIHTGTVVVGELVGAQHKENLALGHVVNLAARLQKEATPGTVVITNETLRLVRGLFVIDELGSHQLEGMSDPVQLHRTVQLSGVRSRLDVAAASGLTPLIGREQDLALLLDRWDRALEGHGQVILIRGEAGIGKSRLMYALRRKLSTEQHSWFECRGSPYHENSAFFPFIELVRQGLRMRNEEAPEAQFARVEQGIDQAGLPEDAIPLIAALLSLPLPERYESLSLSPEAQRRETLGALANWLFALASLQPIIFVFEDLHLVDPSSLELLGKLIDRAAEASILILATFRPFLHPSWGPHPWLGSMTVGPLTWRQAAQMVEQIPAGGSLSAEVIDQVVRKTDGVPLFIEELTKNVLESVEQKASEGEHARVPHSLEIPSTLRDSLAARLDRLGAAKEIAQLAAVIGREFRYELLAAVSAGTAAQLDEALDQLTSAELIYRSQEPRSSTYTFKHALIHETAYQSLLKSIRRTLHKRIALALEDRFPELVARQPEEMARHCEEGILIEKAISYYQRAGELAVERAANPEALGHLTRGIELLDRLPETTARDEQELGLQVRIGSLLVAAKGWGSEEAERVHARTRTLCERVGKTSGLFQALRGLVTFYTARADLTSAFELSGDLLRLAEHEHDTSELLVAHHQIANILYFRGDPTAAVEHYEAAVALYEPGAHHFLKNIYGADLGAFSRSWLAWALWLAGYPDRAVRASQEAMAAAEEASHPFSLAYSQLWAAVVHVMRREPDRTRELARQAIAISEKEGFAFVLGGGRLACAWADLQPDLGGRALDAVMERVQGGLAAVAATGVATGVPGNLSFFADRYRAVGRPDEAFQTVEAALAFAEKTQQLNWNAELNRIKAVLMLETGAGETLAERLLEDSLALARRQRARSIELRVAMTLATLWKGRGDNEAAYDLLKGVYERFDEGFDTPDLTTATTLLNALA